MGDLALSEPSTAATDLLLAVCALVWGRRLARRGARARSARLRLWSGAFLVAALAAACGGVGHGLSAQISGVALPLVWGATIAAIAAATVLMLLAGVESATQPHGSGLAGRRSGIRALRVGVAVTVAALIVLALPWPAYPYFNRFDLTHLLLLLALWQFYRAAGALSA